MASGGYQPNKQAKSETKRRSNWQRSVSSDRDDAQSLNSLPSDIRINNWDLSDLRPTNLGGDSKRRKKSKGNPEREREQSLSMESPPHDSKHHTPSSYPRTKITPSTPTSQRVALENLKQHMTFSDMEDQVSTDGERNNERQMSHSRRRLHNASFNRTDSENDVRGTRDRQMNRNNNMDYVSREQGPDSNEIVARLMQIRDFMKQARSMLESMEKLGDRKKTEDVEKVRRLIRNLQEQEQGYRGLLQNTLAHRDDAEDGAVGGEDDARRKIEVKEDSDDDDSVDLEVRTEESETTENSQDSRPRIESKLGIGSDDDDDDERDEEDQYAEPLRGAAGHTPDNSNTNRGGDQDDTLIQGQYSLPGMPVQESEEGARGATAVDGEGVTSHQQELMRVLKEKQQQLQALMNRQEELNMKRRETEKKLMEAQARDNTARAALAAVSTGRQIVEQRLVAHQALSRELEAAAWDANEEEAGSVGEDKVLKSNIVGYPESDDEDNSNVREVESLPNELLELKRQLNYLRNEFSQVTEAPKNVESETRALAEGRQQLQDKLQELQAKKSRMDSLLQELQMLHAQPLDHLRNNETNPSASASNPQVSTSVASNIPAVSHQQQQKAPPRPAVPNLPPAPSLPANLQARMNDMATAAPGAVENAMATFAQLASEGDQESGSMDPQMVEEVQEKLRRLREVRGQLDQLRGLVQYYQGQKDEADTAADGDDQSSLPGFSDRGDRSFMSRQVNADMRGSQSSLPQPQQQQKQKSPEQQLQELLRLRQQQNQQQQRHQGDDGGSTATSLHNMVQLLNLAGTDQGDEHSDEDNASVSQSDSQWSNLGPWDDDPEIQEKVKKLKAAKEKLRQLQDLVAFVQQSPDAARALPENLGELAASVEGEAVSQATQTDEPNVSMSEGEVPSESMRMPQRDDVDGLENPRAELDRLRKERAMLLEIQNQLKHIHNQVGRSQPGQGSEMQERGEQNSDTGKPGSEQAPNATVVTFASNDELYSKMRRQRILREELRSKKKELEAIMKKDRNKRQYSRNQDNQSDTVSLNTDTFGIPASVDATMATWGGSTVDNLENITEDEDGQERNDRVDDNDEDDGYPSDGIVQVEEEEEENDSDNGTYTIEADARQRKNSRKGATMGIGARPKTSRGRQTFPQPGYNERTLKKTVRKQNSSRATRSQRDSKLRQENYRSAQQLMQEEESVKGNSSEWFRLIEDRLSNLSTSVESLLRRSETESRQLSVSLSQENAAQGSSLISPMQEQMLQLQNQSMMLSFGQLVQSLARQQGDMQHLQQQMQALQLQVQEVHHDHSFHGGAGVGSAHLLRPALSNAGLSNSNYNLQAAATVGPHSLSLSHQQMPSPFTQTALNNTAPAGYFGSFPAPSPGLRNLQSGGLGLSSSNLSVGGERGAAGGAGGLGVGLSVNTGSSLSLPQQGAGASFTFHPMGQSTLNNHSARHQASQAGSSVSTMTRDFSQFVNTLQSTPPPVGSGYGQFTNLFGSSSQQQQQSSLNSFPFLSSQIEGEENDGLDDENPVPRLSSYTLDNSRNKKRKYGSRVKKSESDPTSGLRMSTPKVESSQSRDPVASSTHRSWERSTTTGASFDGGSGFDGGAAFDASSSYSSIQSIRDQHSRLRGEQTQSKSTDASADGNTLFDTLRDTIYTEVASLISQNENRPHFLLELFRDIRQIDSDFMRQRMLYSVQELLRSNLRTGMAATSSAPSWTKATRTADNGNSELTPSESVTSEDDEEIKVTRLQEQITAAERGRLDEMARSRALRNFPFDYAETADNPSSLSTPTNGCEESPFFQDTLGETVIEFDSLKREEEERQRRSQGRSSRQASQAQAEDGRRGQRYGKGGFLASEQLLKDMRSSKPREERRVRGATGGQRSLGSQSSEVASSSAMDQASESSMSDMPYPRMDMKQLDRQIKDIMMETIPVVKEHMDDVCSTQLLGYIKRLVLSLTSQIGNQEFARFFQRQLASILEDTLQKYEGRKMRECGEDLLVEISDVLFNELAFFRLMQDLDDPNVAGKIKAAEWPTQVSNGKDENSSEYSASESSSAGDDDNDNDDDDDDDDDNDDKNDDGDNNEVIEDNNTQRGFRITESEQDELGRERDDELANEVSIRDSEKDEDETEQSYKIELAPSETKPFTRIGSDEDDDEGDEERSMDDPSETAVSRDSMLETNGQVQPTAPSSARPETEGARGDGAEKQDQEKPISPRKSGQISIAKPQGEGDGAEDLSTNNTTTAVTDTTQMNGTVNGGNNNNSDEELTVDDLPERLTVPAAAASASTTGSNNNNTLELRRRYEEEQRDLSGIDAILASLGGMMELAGDEAAIVDPDTFLS